MAKDTVSLVDNGSLWVDSVRLGVLSVSGTGTAGTLYFDDFKSRRRSNIGILPEPGVEEPEPVAEAGWNAVKYTYDAQKTSYAPVSWPREEDDHKDTDFHF